MNVEDEEMGDAMSDTGIGLMYDNRSTQEQVEYLPEQESL